MSFAVIGDWRFQVQPFVKRTDCYVFYREGGRERRTNITVLHGVFEDKVTAQRLADQLTSAKAEKERREREARLWFEQRKSDLIKAAGAEA